jgi:hypothetical protein
MCKFHQDIALGVARHPDGTIDTIAFAVNAIALGTNFYIETYVPQMPDISGYDTYEMASTKGQTAFAESGIVYNAQAAANYQESVLPLLQQKTQEIIDRRSFGDQTLKKLRTVAGAIGFINRAPDTTYVPFDNLSPEVFDKQEHITLYQELRLAAAELWSDSDVQTAFKELFVQSVAATFTGAVQKVNPTLLTVYEAIPDGLKPLSTCAGGVCASAGGTMLGHLGCVAKVALLPALGATSGMADSPIAMITMMAGGTALGVTAWQALHRQRGTEPTTLEKAMTYGTAVGGLGLVTVLHLLGHHDHSQMHQMHEEMQMLHHHNMAAALWQRSDI